MTVATKLPPGPKGRLLTGNLGEFHKDILGFYERLHREYGDCAAFRLANRKLVLVSDPDWIERILVTDSRDFAKLTYVLKLIVPLLGNGLLTSDGDFWLRQRRLIQPVFSRQRIDSYAPIMVDYTQRMLQRWQDGATIDIHEEMMRLALEIVAKVLFDADVDDDADVVGDALIDVMHNFLDRWGSFLPLPAWLPTASNRRYYRSIRRLDKIVYRFIAERRASQEERNDLLSILLQARDEDDGSRMNDKQLRDEIMTLFLAGHETTALVLSYAWLLLAQSPHVEKRLLEELQSVLEDRALSVEHVPKLKYAEAVILESMRLYPPAYAFARTAKKPYQVGDFHLPAGTTFLLSQWIMQRDPRYWDEPDEFRPERWLDGSADKIPKYAYFPFGGGPRKCIGDAFAMTEAVLILATMAPRVRFEIAQELPVKLRPAVVLRPESGIQLKVVMP